MALIEKDYWKVMKIPENFGENLLEVVEKRKIFNIWWIISIRQVKLRNFAENFSSLDNKWTKFWKISRKFWDFLIKISMENWVFSQFFTKYFLEFCLFSKTIYILQDNTSFLQQFFRRSPSRFFWNECNHSIVH